MSTFFSRGTSLVTTEFDALQTTLEWNDKKAIQWIDRTKIYDYELGSCPSKLIGEMLSSRSVI